MGKLSSKFSNLQKQASETFSAQFKLSTRDLKIFALASFQSFSMYRNCAQESQSTV